MSLTAWLGCATVPGVPRLLPRVAIAFIAVWLARDVTIDALSILTSPGAFAPLGNLSATHSTVAVSDTERDLRVVGATLRPGDTVAVRVLGGGQPDALRWAAGYWLFPHHVTVSGPGTPTEDVVVVSPAGDAALAPPGYASLPLPGASGHLVAFRRAS
jgi:hypothetical protein